MNQKERQERAENNKEGSGRRAGERQDKRRLKLSWVSGEHNLEADMKLRDAASGTTVSSAAAL